MKIKNLIAVAALLMGSTSASAQVYADGYLRYSVSAGKATITGFVANQEVAAVEIPAQVQDPVNATKKYDVEAIGAGAFEGKTIITSVTIADTNVGKIQLNAFKNCTNLTTVTIGKKVLTIDNAFNGCSKLQTVKFNTPAAGDFQTIAPGAFVGTAIQTLDLTASHVQILQQLFEPLNATLVSVKLPTTLTRIESNAFRKLTKLVNVDFSACTTVNFDIADYVFDGVPLITELELPSSLQNLEDDALAGSNIKTLTINSNKGATVPNQSVGDQSFAAKLTTLVVKGDFKGIINGPFTSLTSVTFEGNVTQAGALAGGVFVDCDNLATIDFKGNLVAGAVAAGALGDGSDWAGDGLAWGQMLTISYSPAEVPATKVASFDLAAIDPSSGGLNIAKLSTATWYKKWLKDNSNEPYKFAISAAAATSNLKVANNGEGKWYYAKLYSDSPYKIAKKQGDATVVVYGAYVDDSDATVYMENLQIYDGFYWVPAYNPVIIKSSANADVVLTASEETYSSVKRNDNTYGKSNEIRVWSIDDTGLSVKDWAATFDEVPYMIAPFADYGFLWSKFKDERVIKGMGNVFNPATGVTTADFLITCPANPGARINVVWLDGSEEATAIQSVKTAAIDNDAIYNLAGQKVNAAYKGVVIKNGKKMIQK